MIPRMMRENLRSKENEHRICVAKLFRVGEPAVQTSRA